jgi:hypothetical protein
MEIFSALRQKDEEAHSMAALSMHGRMAGEKEQALDWGRRALAACTELNSPSCLVEALRAMGLARTAAGDFHGAVASLSRAVEILEDQRALLEGSEQRSGFFSGAASVYEELAQALLASPPTPGPSPSPAREMGQGGEMEAFFVSERMKARSFLDEMGAARFTREGAPAELLEQKRLLEARMKWLTERAD